MRPTPPADLSTEDAARLRRRYPPPRVPRAVVVAAVALGAAVGLGWLVWAALFHANPAVSGLVSAYTVRSDTAVDVTLTVDRPDPSVPATCRIRVQAPDYTTVGEKTVEVPPGPDRVVNVRTTITTLRRATSPSVAECSTA